jgi:uncharacterized protein
MKRIVFILYLACLVPWLSRAADDDTAKSLLWRISNPEMKHPSYLFGTIHLICPEDYVWTGKMQKSFDAVEEVCFEMDMDDPMLMLTIAKGMINDDGKELNDYFTADEYKKIERFLIDSIGMDVAMFSKMKPSALQSVFVSKIVNCPNPLTYEFVMMEEAKKKKKDITGLEEPKEQIELFLNMPTDSIVRGLIEVVDKNAEAKADYQKMVTAYKNQDIALLHQIIQDSSDLTGTLDRFLDDRNIRWIERMVDKMDQRSIFFAVGAGHLPGQNGVINLLRKAGYTVVPVK